MDKPNAQVGMHRSRILGFAARWLHVPVIIAAIVIGRRFPIAAATLVSVWALWCLLRKPCRATVVGAIVGSLIGTGLCLEQVVRYVSLIRPFDSHLGLLFSVLPAWLGIGAALGAFLGCLVGDLARAIRAFRDEKRRASDERNGILEPLAADRTRPPTEPVVERRWYQFTLGTLLMVMLLASIGMSWVAARVDRATKHRAAIETLKNLGGTYRFGRLDLGGTKVTDRDLCCLVHLSRVTWLDLSGTTVSDSALVHLQSFAELEVLSLADTQITDAGVEHLKSLPQLRILVLRGTKVTDAGVQDLRKALPDIHMER